MNILCSFVAEKVRHGICIRMVVIRSFIHFYLICNLNFFKGIKIIKGICIFDFFLKAKL